MIEAAPYQTLQLRHDLPSMTRQNNEYQIEGSFPTLNDDSDSDDGTNMFAKLKLRAEAKKAKIEKRNRRAERRARQMRHIDSSSKSQDCFSVSSLEVDLDTDENDSDEGLDYAMSRFSAQSRQDSNDFTPSRPRSSETSIPCDALSSWQSAKVSYYSEDDDDDEPPSLQAHLREDRWSTHSDRVGTDPLGVLLDRVSSSYQEKDYDSVLLPPLRARFSSDGHKEPGTPKMPTRSALDVPHRGNTKSAHWRWQGQKPSPKDTLRSPSRYRG